MKANFDKIKGGMMEQDMLSMLDAPTNPTAGLDPEAANYDKATAQIWSNGSDSITVTYCDHKAARWVGVFMGQTYTMMDPAYVLTKPTPTTPAPKPGTTSLITKANFDSDQRRHGASVQS